MKSNSSLPSLAGLPARALSRLSRNALVICVVVSVVASVLLGVFVFRPAYREFNVFRENAHKALIDRNREIIRSALEQSAGDMVRLLGAAEDAARKIAETASASHHRSQSHSSPMPLEPDFQRGGRLEGLLQSLEGYEKPVTFQLPQVKLGRDEDSRYLAPVWPAFLNTTKALHAHHPELKWLYLGTGAGSFLVFPSSPQIPPDYDPRKRDWYQQALKSDGLIWTSPYFTAGGNDLVLTAAMKLKNRQDVIGVDVVMADVVTKILSAPYCDRCVFYLVNASGQILGKKGDTLSGASWTEPPKARLLADDLAVSEPLVSATSAARSILAGEKHSQNELMGLSRASRADWIRADTTKLDLISAPIANTRWFLVGSVPKNYAGQDGESILSSLSGFAEHYRWTLLLIALACATLSALCVLILFRQAKRTLRSSLSPTINQFAELAKRLESLKLDQAEDSDLSFGNSLTREHAQVVGAVRLMRQRLVSEAKAKEDLNVRAKLGEHAREVAHNMRSPLKALEMIVPSLAGATPNQQKVLKSVVAEIRDLANSLHTERQIAPASAMVAPSKHRSEILLLSSLVESVVSERRVAFKDRSSVEIDAELDATSYGIFVQVEPTELRCVLANLINNAVESIKGEGSVRVFLKSQDGRAILEIRDSGIGIDPTRIRHLLTDGGSFDKPGGSGIGLRHARVAISRWTGEIAIESRVGSGTLVRITLPSAPTPSWFLQKIDLTDKSCVFVVDDDDALRQLWEYRLGSVSRGPTTVRTFSDLPTFKSAVKSMVSGFNNALVLMDYEFRGHQQTGLDAIEELGIASSSILVTAHSDEDTVVARARFMGVPILPKAVMESVPLCGQTLEQ